MKTSLISFSNFNAFSMLSFYKQYFFHFPILHNTLKNNKVKKNWNLDFKTCCFWYKIECRIRIHNYHSGNTNLCISFGYSPTRWRGKSILLKVFLCFSRNWTTAKNKIHKKLFMIQSKFFFLFSKLKIVWVKNYL